MSQNIFIGAAWPYANGSLHLGHIAGCYLPADIFARYNRMIGNQVLMVSGSDQHGTPITLRAEEEGTTPEEVVNRYHSEFLDCWEKLGISFDLFTTTRTSNHRDTVHDIFETLRMKGHIYTGKSLLPFCHSCQRFLPDRYVNGQCPYCDNPDARGDQCDNCGKPLNPEELINIRCRISGDKPDIRETEHFFLKLSDFGEDLLEWVTNQRHWRPNALNFTRRYLEEGLHDRAITRDLDWGISIPVTGYDNKRIYVWFEAVIGYLSASKEWSAMQGNTDLWKNFWDGNAKSYYFIGKDNIPFHTIIWPAMLMGYGNTQLPYDVPANEFLTLELQQLSKSRNWAVWLPDYLSRFDPDPLRYYLSATMPETSDSDFSWSDFIKRNNDELLATFGNLANRVLTFTYRNVDGSIPLPSNLDTEDLRLLDKTQKLFETVSDQLSGCHFRMALNSAMDIAREANRYLEQKEPWKTIKNDASKTATTLWVSLNVLNGLKIALYPFLPFSSEKLNNMLGFNETLDQIGWQWDQSISALPPGQKLVEPFPLYEKLEDDLATEEIRKLKDTRP
jgi:methionyl-tRNA synthetase